MPTPTYPFEIDSRPASLGEGWRLRLFEDAVEVCDGVLPQIKRAARSSYRCIEQATSWLRSLGWIEETVGPLEDRGKRWVAARMSGCVQREQALAHEVVGRGRLLDLKRRPDIELTQHRERKETCFDLPHCATQAQSIPPHSFADYSRFLEIPIGRMGGQYKHEVSIRPHSTQAIISAD